MLISSCKLKCFLTRQSHHVGEERLWAVEEIHIVTATKLSFKKQDVACKDISSFEAVFLLEHFTFAFTVFPLNSLSEVL